ncbi:MAG: peptidoglycan-associated lipoprotein Pal [Alphaproteobacteria bacterium]|jgi:peptidoglycan-associated lipoprotein|nr:peptidoglycan-associated lipoprotein Pal [Alphaproteobacteria bacterium]MDP6589956.1 peptidoglycan-associated lipoprotein Pal [Alphaproteobacteria bacterium]
MVAMAAVLLIAAACSSTSDDNAATVGDGDAADTASAQTDQSSATDSSADAAVDVAAVESSGPIPGSQEDLVQNVGDRVFFEYDSAVLTPEGRRTLERQAEWLRLFPELKIMIEGHCDERGTREYNLALGERRATAARDYLIAFGMDSSRLQTTSYGKERPYALGHNEESWKRNRRSVTVVN